jgi:soluble lytic murein transglycosylase
MSFAGLVLVSWVVVALGPGSADAEERLDNSADPQDVLLDASACLRLGHHQDALDLLGSIPDVVSPLLRDKADYLAARALLESGEVSRAISLMEGLRDHPRRLLRNLVRQALARAHLLVGDGAKALGYAVTVDPWPPGTRLELQRVQLWTRAAMAGGDEQTGKQVLGALADSDIPEEERLVLVVQLKAHLGVSIRSDCRRLRDVFPCYPLPEQCNSVRVRSSKDRRKDALDAAKVRMKCRDYGAARDLLEPLVASKSTAANQQEARLLLAEIHHRKLRDRRDVAYRHYEWVYENGRDLEARQNALHQMARCQMNLDRYDKALSLFRRYVREFPKGRHRESADYYLGWLPYDQGKWKEALPGLKRYLARYRKTELRHRVEVFHADSLYQLGRLDDALAAFQQSSASGTGLSAFRSAYWEGVSHGEKGDNRRAKAVFQQLVRRDPLSYYGLMSWRHLDEQEQADHPLLYWSPSIPVAPTSLLLLEGVPQNLLAVLQPVADAVDVGEPELARTLFQPHRQRFLDAVPERDRGARVRDLGELLDEPDVARQWGRRQFGRTAWKTGTTSPVALQLEYPRAYRRLVEVESRKTGVPSWFVYAIMRAESRYQRGVVSWADAMGLMQLIPPTALRVAQEKQWQFDLRDVFDPPWNIRLAVAYLGMLGNDFRGQWVLVAPAYNAGPQAVRQFVKKAHGRALDRVVENVAYNGARDYCRNVVGHALHYVLLYAPVDRRRALVESLLPRSVDFQLGDAVQF